MKTPVLILAFNRPDKVQQVINCIRLYSPSQLFLSVDGPRSDRPGEAGRVQEVRNLVNSIDWPCQVYTLFHKENKGCRQAVSEAISWFFEHVPEGIILEDDCLPHPTFFPYCEELLDRYRHEESVMMIAGSNLVPEYFRQLEYSYVFSHFALIWGWATWRRAWKKMDVHVTQLDSFKQQNLIAQLIPDKTGQSYLLDKFEDTRKKVNDSWAYAWFYSMLLNKGLSAIPCYNLVQNIGIDEEATHTRKGLQSGKFQKEREGMRFPLTHPPSIQVIPPKLAMEVFYANYKPKILLWVNKIIPLHWLKWTRKIMQSFFLTLLLAL